MEARFELRKELVGALDSLSPSSREAILLRYFEGHPPRDIAKHQGIPLATVKTRLRRGLGRLREALDERYGEDREAWMSAAAMLTVPAGSGVATGTLMIGGMAMGTMMKVSGAVLVAAACVFYVTRTPEPETPQVAAADPPATGIELVGATEDLVAKGVPRTLAAEEPAGGVTIARGANVLRVVLEEIATESALATRVTLLGADERTEWPAEIRESWPCQGLTSEFDLGPFLASVAERDGDLRIDELVVEVDHALHLPATSRVSLDSGVERDGGQTVFEVRVRMDPAGVLHGRLMREDGVPASGGLVGALLLEGDYPVKADGRAVECAEDGAFELRVDVSGPYALASYEGGRRPATTRTDAVTGTRVNVGTIVLEPGLGITGRALRQGKPLAGATLSATPPTWKTAAATGAANSGMRESVYEGRTFHSPDRSVHLLWLPPNFTSRSSDSGRGSRRNGRFELAGQDATVDESGAFAFGGLGSGDYLLRIRDLVEAQDAVPGYWDDAGVEDRYRIHGDRPALVVRAPEHGIEFGLRWTSIRFALAGDLADEQEGRLVLRSPSAHATPVDENGKDLRLVEDPNAKNLNFTPAVHTREFPVPGDQASFVLQAPPNKRMSGEVTFPGREPVALEFSTPDPGGEVLVPVELVRAESATLIVELENPAAEISGLFSVKLWRDGRHDDPADIRVVEVRDGQLRVENFFPGNYLVRVRAGEGYFSAGLFHESEFEVELLPGPFVSQSVLMHKGAGLRFTMRGEGGAFLTGEYEFYDHSGGVVELQTQVIGKGQWASSWKVFPHGTHESFNELHPGRYRLVLFSEGYAQQDVMVELRAGEYEEVDVTLSK